MGKDSGREVLVRGRSGAPRGTQPGRTMSPAASGDLQVVQRTDLGCVRPHNEDYVDHRIPQDPHERERKGVVCLVADGMGGHRAGEVASKQAVEGVIQQYYGDMTHDAGTSLVRAFRAANRMIYELAQADPSKAGMGTTLVGAVILGQKVYVANVGDSRAYIIGSEGAIQITEDHSWVSEQVRAGLLKPEEARQHPQRNLVLRALGSKASVEVDLFEGTMAEGDSLLLCTDGLTNYVNELEIEQAVREHSATEALDWLIEKAKERGGSDNISAVVASLRPVASPAPELPTGQPRAAAIPLIPVLVGAAVLLALAAIGIWLLPALLRPKATPTASRPVGATLTVSVTAPVPTLPTPAVVTTLTAVSAPAPGGTLQPTATLIPTSTQPSATSTAHPTGTSTPVVKPTYTAGVYPPPTLLNPAEPGSDRDSGLLQGIVTFRWSYSRPLATGEAFQVWIWRDGQPHSAAAALVRTEQQTIDLGMVPQIQAGGPGEYFWTAVVVDSAPEQPLSSETAAWRFQYLAPTPSPAPSCVVCVCWVLCRFGSCNPCCQSCCSGCQ